MCRELARKLEEKGFSTWSEAIYFKTAQIDAEQYKYLVVHYIKQKEFHKVFLLYKHLHKLQVNGITLFACSFLYDTSILNSGTMNILRV